MTLWRHESEIEQGGWTNDGVGLVMHVVSPHRRFCMGDNEVNTYRMVGQAVALAIRLDSNVHRGLVKLMDLRPVCRH